MAAKRTARPFARAPASPSPSPRGRRPLLRVPDSDASQSAASSEGGAALTTAADLEEEPAVAALRRRVRAERLAQEATPPPEAEDDLEDPSGESFADDQTPYTAVAAPLPRARRRRETPEPLALALPALGTVRTMPPTLDDAVRPAVRCAVAGADACSIAVDSVWLALWKALRRRKGSGTGADEPEKPKPKPVPPPPRAPPPLPRGVWGAPVPVRLAAAAHLPNPIYVPPRGDALPPEVSDDEADVAVATDELLIPPPPPPPPPPMPGPLPRGRWGAADDEAAARGVANAVAAEAAPGAADADAVLTAPSGDERRERSRVAQALMDLTGRMARVRMEPDPRTYYLPPAEPPAAFELPAPKPQATTATQTAPSLRGSEKDITSFSTAGPTAAELAWAARARDPPPLPPLRVVADVALRPAGMLGGQPRYVAPERPRRRNGAALAAQAAQEAARAAQAAAEAAEAADVAQQAALRASYAGGTTARRL